MTNKPKTVTISKVRTALRALGDTPGAIAKSLKKKGIRGVPLDSCRCPLAVYLQKTLNLFTIVGDIEGVKSYIIVYETVGGDPLVEVQGSKVAQKFVEKFDTGAYPFLVAE